MSARRTIVQSLVAAMGSVAMALGAAPPAGAVAPPTSAPLRTAAPPTRTAPAAAPGQAPSLHMPQDLTAPAAKPMDAAEVPESVPAEAGRDYDAAAYRRAVKSGQAALRSEDWSEAASQLQAALQMNPSSKEVAYNLGIAKFRQGDFAAAEQLFKTAAQSESADLAAKSMFNEGNSIYASVVKGLPAGAGNTVPGNAAPAVQSQQPDLRKGIESAQKAFTHFKDASAANPGDDDSAVNAETAFKLLKQLQEEQKKQQQQQQQKQDQDQQQKQDQDQSQQQQQNQQDKQNQSKDQQQQQQQQQQQDNSSQQDQSQQQKQNQSRDQNQQGKEPEQDQTKDQDPKDQRKDQESSKDQDPSKDQDQKQDGKPQDQTKQDDGSKPQPAAAQDAGQADDSKMDPQQAARLLQLVRDKEKQRNAEKKAKVSRTMSAPAGKDW
jgi:hypothetical protein